MLIVLNDEDPPGTMPKLTFLTPQKVDLPIGQSPGGASVPIPIRGDEDLLDMPIGGRGK